MNVHSRWLKKLNERRKGWSWFFMSDERLWLCLCACKILMGVFLMTKRGGRSLEGLLWVGIIIGKMTFRCLIY